MQKKDTTKLTRRAALARLGVAATAVYVAPGLAGFSAAHASDSSGSDGSSSSSVSSDSSVSSTASGQSLPSDAGITQDQIDAYDECAEGGGSVQECLDAVGIVL